MRIPARLLSALAGGVVAAAVTAAPATAAPPPGTPLDTGCPVGHETLAVEPLTLDGYRVPQDLDSHGNQDGLVCGRPLNAVQSENLCPTCTHQLYAFDDNVVTPRH